MNTLSANDFCDEIANAIESGDGFLPLLGAGMSVSAGIPTISNLRKYLYYCLLQAISGKWDPQTQSWPPLERAFKSTCEHQQTQERITQVLASDLDLQCAAIGALSDWRETLRFLSRLRRNPSHGFRLGPPSDLVADAAFSRLVSETKPGLPHQMLVHLADGLRIRTILTTNFDALIEDAFESHEMPVSTFIVHRTAGLPPASLVEAQRAVVKLHGGRFGLRADYSLDERPTEKDQQAFSDYFSSLHTTDAAKHIFVLGVSGQDLRTIQLIHRALQDNERMQVFWACFLDTESEQVEKAFRSVTPYFDRARLKITIQRETGLFLLQLYQRIFLSLPPPGAGFPALSKVPPYPYQSDDRTQPFQTTLEQLHGHLESRTKSSTPLKDGETNFPIVVHGNRGISSVAAQVWQSLSAKQECVWLELDTCSSMSNLFAVLIESIAFKLGAVSELPVLPELKLETCISFLQDLLRRSPNRFVVFLNGRDGVGQNIGIESNCDSWINKDKEKFWDAVKGLQTLSKFEIVVLCRAGESKFLQPPSHEESYTIVENSADAVKVTPSSVFERVRKSQEVDVLSTEKDDGRFLYSLTLFRRSRLPAALLSWPLLRAPVRGRIDNQDNDKERAKTARKKVDALTRCGVGRYQPGGSFWMHETVRTYLRETLLRERQDLVKETATCHQGIADWYEKLFRSSDDPGAALESIYHRLKCAEEVGPGEVDLRETALREAVQTLKLARESILSCAHFGTCVDLMCSLVKFCDEEKGSVAVVALRRECCAVLRDFCKEIGDFDGARDWSKKLEGSPRTADTQLSSLRKKYEHAVRLKGKRLYEDSSNEFRNLIQSLRVKGFPDMGTKDSDSLIVNMRMIARAWCRDVRPSQEERELTIKAMREYQFLLLLKAQLTRRTGKAAADKEMHLEINREEKKLLWYCEGLYTFSTTVMRHIENHDFLQVENAFIRTHTGILLANMRRFWEAHRRLNEASGYLRQSSKAVESVPWAVIELRRAEVYLRQAQYAGAASKAAKSAYLEDSQIALWRAKRWLAMRPTSVWWWGLYYELRLTVCEGLASIAVDRCRDCMGDWQCSEVFRLGTRLVTEIDPVRTARFVELWNQTEVSCKRFDHRPTAPKELEDAVNSLKESRCTGMVGQYIAAVLGTVDKSEV